MSTYTARVRNYNTLTPGTICTIVGLTPCTLTLATQPSNIYTFPPDAEFNNQHKAAASINSARPQKELDYIEYVVKHWQHGIEQKDKLTEFRRLHKKGN